MKKIFTTILLTLAISHANAWAVPIAAGLEDLDGKSTQLDSQSKKVLVVFWATWCPSCRSEFSKDLPELAKLAGVEVLTVNTDTDRDRAKDFVTREKIPFKVFRDPSKAFRKQLQVLAVPHWAVYERKGTSEWSLVSSQGAFEIEAVKKALAVK
jgi:thiol-disulfide isomerase/thioredoxin